MSYANPDRRQALSLPGLAGAVTVSSACMTLMIFAAPEIMGKAPEPPLSSIMPTRSAPKPVPPPNDPAPPPEIFTPKQSHTQIVPPVVPRLAPPKSPPAPVLDPTPPLAPPKQNLIPPPPKSEPAELPRIEPPKPPVIVAARFDPRFEARLQPPYPRNQREAGIEGRVTVRVLVGADGRVKEMEMVRADNTAFFTATDEHARNNWRFNPATRDGVPQESWRTMTLVFRLETD